jgi:hypothetical protein
MTYTNSNEHLLAYYCVLTYWDNDECPHHITSRDQMAACAHKNKTTKTTQEMKMYRINIKVKTQAE